MLPFPKALNAPRRGLRGETIRLGRVVSTCKPRVRVLYRSVNGVRAGKLGSHKVWVRLSRLDFPEFLVACTLAPVRPGGIAQCAICLEDHNG